VSCAKTAERIETLFGLWIWVGPRKHVLHGAHWCHLANTVELPVCGGNAALCQISLITCYWYWYYYFVMLVKTRAVKITKKTGKDNASGGLLTQKCHAKPFQSGLSFGLRLV